MSIQDFERRKLIQQNAEKMAEAIVAELRQEIESLKAQNAAMREALEHPGLVALSTPAAIQRDIALSTTPPSSYVSREAVGPLLLDAIIIMGMVDPVKYADVWTSRAALEARARELGLLE